MGGNLKSVGFLERVTLEQRPFGDKGTCLENVCVGYPAVGTYTEKPCGFEGPHMVENKPGHHHVWSRVNEGERSRNGNRKESHN